MGTVTSKRVLKYSAVMVGLGLLWSCGSDQKAPTADQPIPTQVSIDLALDGSAPTRQQRVEFNLDSVLDRGHLEVFVLVANEVQKLTDFDFHNTPHRSFVSYYTLESIATSTLLFRITPISSLDPSGLEIYCFFAVEHQLIRQTVSVACDRTTTATFFMSARDGLFDVHNPFADIAGRLPIWKSFFDSRNSDLTAFMVSALVTLENTLLSAGSESFNSVYRPVRQVMEALSVFFLDTYQVQGYVNAEDLIVFLRNATGGEIPIGRLLKFAKIFDENKHVLDVQLTHTGGSLTRLTREFQLATLENELKRFFLMGSPLEMSDFRTHLVQNVMYDSTSRVLSWDALPHMYGYNVYVDGLHVGYTDTNQIRITLPSPKTGAIKAVGHAGEFSGVSIRFADQRIRASASN